MTAKGIERMNREFSLSLLPPLVACAMQLALWPWLNPLIWLFFYPAVFLSGMIGGFRGGLASTLVSICIVWFVFMPPQFSLEAHNHNHLFSAVVFAGMGYAISRTHESLRNRRADSEARFSTTFEISATGIVVITPEGRFVRVNSKFCQMLGYSREELVAKSFIEITHPDDLTASLDLQRRSLSVESPLTPLEKRYVRKDGSTIWVNVALSVARSPEKKPDFLIAVVEDIQTRKIAEEDARSSRAMLQAALASMTDAVCISDTKANSVHINDAFAAFYRFQDMSERPRDVGRLSNL